MVESIIRELIMLAAWCIIVLVAAAAGIVAVVSLGVWVWGAL